MAADKKRKAAGAAPAAGQTKRQKTHPAKQGAKKAAKKLEKRPVSVDALRWKSVDVPEMFDDAEGFFGLEVVEGVEIVKEGGKVQFVSISHFCDILCPVLTCVIRSLL